MRLGLARAVFVLAALASLMSAAAVPAAAQSAGWQPGPGASGDNTYDGFIDFPTSGSTVPGSGSFSLGGWFVDKQAEGWAGADNLQVFVGLMGSGGTQVGQGPVGMNRPDVAAALGNPFWAASGFAATVSGVPSGNQTLNVYLHTPGKGWWYKSVNVVGGGSGGGAATPAAPAGAPAAPAGAPAAGGGAATGAPVVTVSEPAEAQNVTTKVIEHTIRGTAYTPGIGATDIDRVEVYINGERDTGTLLGSPTPDTDGNWTVTFRPTNFPSTHANLYVFAHSRSTGKETEFIRGFNITDR